jgi:hypothetical protein
MNQLDREFITSTVTKVVTKANNELEGKLRTFIVEHVSKRIKEVTNKGNGIERLRRVIARL